MHWNDTPAAQDMPFMYSVAFLLILILGPGKYSADFLVQQRKYNMEN
jgi:putative oxidoreductase